MSETRIYDCIVPLGGNCSSALQLRSRKLRQCSLPFDWLYYQGDCLPETYVGLIESHFAAWLERKNLEVKDTRKEPESGRHSSVTDLRCGVTFLHDFLTYPLTDMELETVRAKYQRRIDRLYALCGHADRILFVIAGTAEQLNRERLLEARRRLFTLFPQAAIDIFAVITEASTFEMVESPENGLYLSLTTRKRSTYDLHYRPWEWSWLDSVGLSDAMRDILGHAPQKPAGLLDRWIYKLYKHLKKTLIRRGRLPPEWD